MHIFKEKLPKLRLTDHLNFCATNHARVTFQLSAATMWRYLFLLPIATAMLIPEDTEFLYESLPAAPELPPQDDFSEIRSLTADTFLKSIRNKRATRVTFHSRSHNASCEVQAKIPNSFPFHRFHPLQS